MSGELAVGGELEPDLLLTAHDLADLLVFDGAQRLGTDGAGLVTGARLLKWRGAQQAAHMVGAEWRSRPGHLAISLAPSLWSCLGRRQCRSFPACRELAPSATPR